MTIRGKVRVAEGRGRRGPTTAVLAVGFELDRRFPTLHFSLNIPLLNITIGRALNSNRRRKRIPFIGRLKNFPRLIREIIPPLSGSHIIGQISTINIEKFRNIRFFDKISRGRLRVLYPYYFFPLVCLKGCIFGFDGILS